MKNRIVQWIKNHPSKFSISAVSVLIFLTLAVLIFAGVFDKAPQVPADTTAVSEVSEDKPVLKPSDIKIQAIVSDSTGIDTKSAFKLLCATASDENSLKPFLSVTPQQSYSLQKISQGEYRISFDEAMKSNSIYKFEFKDSNTGEKRSWAFQTKKALTVARTLPRNEATQVPVDSGIEMTFSHENIADPEKYFEINPKTAGRFEIHKKTVVFVPEKLDYGTVYTIKVKSGLSLKGGEEKLQDDYIFKFQTVLSESSQNSMRYFSFSDEMNNFTPQTIPALQVFAQESLVDTAVDTEVFKYAGEDQFVRDLKKYDSLPVWAVMDRSKIVYDTSKMEKVAAVKAQIVKSEGNYWYSMYLLLPAELPEGHYVVKAVVDGRAAYTQMQVSNSAVYIMVGSNRTLAWVNDAASGKPLKDALLSGENFKPVKTGEDGMAQLDESLPQPSPGRCYYFTITAAGRPAFIARVDGGSNYLYDGYYNDSYYNNRSSIIDNYWTYIYLDKGVYLPNDTVNVWGLIKPRDESKTTSKAILEISRYDYSRTGGGEEIVIDSKEIQLTHNGTFTDKLELSSYNPGSYYISVKMEDQVMLQMYFSVMEYTKPSYKIDLQPERNAAFAWDKVNIGIQANFFEGSPLPGLKLDYNYYVDYNSHGGGGSGKITCDPNGYASFRVDPSSATNSWHPQSLDFSVNNTNAEEEEIRSSCRVTIFPRDTMIEVDGKTDGGQGIVDIRTSRIDISKLKGKSYNYFAYDDYRGSPVDTVLLAKLYEKHYEKRETGDYYDYINKKKVIKYEYYEVRNLIQEYAFSTVQGAYQIKFPANKDLHYYIEVTGNDSRNNEIIESQGIFNWANYSPYEQQGFSLVEADNKSSFKTGDKVSLDVKYEGGDLPSDKSYTFLYVRLKNGIMEYATAKDASYSFNFTEKYIPNMYVKAVCFDGTNVYDAGINSFRYDQQESGLDIRVRPDKASYKPGDTVKLNVDVKDAGGKPCSAEVNISVIDEAFFAVMEQYVDTLGGLYWPAVSSGLTADYFSFKPIDTNGNPMAEGGEGGDEVVRTEFKDSAFFASATSGKDGKAEIEFKLPDNLTSWRVTYQGVTGDMKAGSGKVNITSKLPFFVDTVFNKVFITGDSPSVLVRSYGTELRSSDTVKYAVTVENSAGYKKTYDSQAKGNNPAFIALGGLAEGSYTLTAKAASGNLQDALQRSFTVSGSLLEAARIKYYDLAEDTKIEGGTSLTELSFFNKDSSDLYEELYSLYWSWGERIDQKLSRKLAGELLKKYYNEESVWDEEFDFGKYQMNDGGLAILSYDSSSPELSAKLCSLVGDAVDRSALKSYFYNILNNKDASTEDVAFSYWGLASMNEPVLIEIKNLLASPGIELKEKLVLGIALAEIGDFEGSGEIYSGILAQKGKTVDSYTYIDTGSGRDDTTEATVLCAIIALKNGTPERMQLFNYAKSNSTSELLTNLERLIFITSYMPGVSQESSFSYELDGVKKAVVLKKAGQYKIILTPDKLAGIKFYNISGSIAVAASTTGPVKDLVPGSGSLVGIERKYSVDGRDTKSFKRSGLVKVTLKPVFMENTPDGFYEITDILPAGLRHVAGRPGEDRGWYADEVSGQKVVFGYYYRKSDPQRNSIVYYARAVSPGTFTADNTMIRQITGNMSGFADRVTVTVE